MELRKAIQQITGTEPDDAQIQKLMAIAHALEIPPNDSMMAVLAMLDVYHGIYTQMPNAVAESVSQVAKGAANIAEADMVTAVSKLVPTVSKAVGEAAKQAVDRIQMGKSVWTMWLSTIFVGIVLVLGFLCGLDVYGSYINNHISVVEFWELTKWGIAEGLSLPTLMIMSLWLFSIDSKYRSEAQTVFAYISGAIVLLMSFLIMLNLIQAFMHGG